MILALIGQIQKIIANAINYTDHSITAHQGGTWNVSLSAGYSRSIAVTPLISAVALGSGGTYTTSAVNVEAGGAFAVQGDVVSSGTVSLRVSYLCSLDGTTYYTPDGGSEIITLSSSGYTGFAPNLCKYMKIYAENLELASVTSTIYLGRQVS